MLLLCQTKPLCQWNNPTGQQPLPGSCGAAGPGPKQPTWQPEPGLERRTGNKPVCLLAATPKFSVHVDLFTQQTDFFYEGSWWDLPQRSDVANKSTCFPEHTSAPVHPGSIPDICADLALFLSPPQWIFFKNQIGLRQKNNPPPPQLQNSTEQLILSARNCCWWTSRIPVSLSARRGQTRQMDNYGIFLSGRVFF